MSGYVSGAEKPQPDGLLLLNKVTLRYNKAEDRIRMDAQSGGGQVVAFWFTQRLCRELIKGFVNYFDKASPVTTRTLPHNLAAVQGFLHGKARGSIKPASPVGDSGVQVELINKLQMRASNNRVQIEFPLPEKTRAVLVMKPMEARQWLDILYQQYLLADWSVDIWPDWVKSPQSNKEAPTLGDERVH